MERGTYLRRAVGRGPWHFCMNCANWPASAYEATTDPVPEDEICKGCQRQSATGNCRQREA
jgi:hypothetical protein